MKIDLKSCKYEYKTMVDFKNTVLEKIHYGYMLSNQF